ncbi:MAG TPA: sigma-70 family RNA polymerase sigma factor [Symbiobacteriaceae bacterium]|nr:sigma-70 family RNA polymerase sigma factor [Symbiobacteriaceae bacterium]
MPDNELQLVLEAIGGNADSFGRLADRYSPTILGLAYSLTGDMELARDVAQETLLKAYTSLSSLRRPDRFGSWLRQIAANLARTQLRSQGRHPQVGLDELPEQGGVGLEETVDRRLARQEVLRTLQSVPEGPRAAVVLHYVVGMAPAEAARHLGISRAAFDTRLSRGRDALRRELTILMDEALTEAKQQVEVYLEGLSERVKSALRAEPRERVTAAKELALLAARANLPRLFRDLKGHDEGVRKLTAQLLGDTLDRRAVAPLMEALQTEDVPAVQAELARSLARLGATAAVPALHALSRNTADMTVHKAADDAVKALSNPEPPGGDGDIPVEIDDLKAAGMEALLLDLLADDTAPVRVHAADGLGRVESVKAVPQLAAVLGADPQPYVRRAAAEALGAILWPGRTSKERITPAQRAKAVEALAAALSDPDMAVQAEAAWSLSLVTPDAQRPAVMQRFHEVLEVAVTGRPGPWWVTFPALAGALGTESDRARIAGMLLRKDVRFKGPLVEAVLQLSRPSQTEANPLVIEAVQTHADPKCEHKLLKALGVTLDPEALPLLQTALKSPQPLMREAAAHALARYPHGQQQLKEAMSAGDEALITAAAGAIDDPAFLEELAPRLSPRGRITLQAAARRLARTQGEAQG